MKDALIPFPLNSSTPFIGSGVGIKHGARPFGYCASHDYNCCPGYIAQLVSGCCEKLAVFVEDIVDDALPGDGPYKKLEHPGRIFLVQKGEYSADTSSCNFELSIFSESLSNIDREDDAADSKEKRVRVVTLPCDCKNAGGCN